MIKYIITGIAICNACLNPCKVVPKQDRFKVESICCKATIVHRNVMLKFKREYEK